MLGEFVDLTDALERFGCHAHGGPENRGDRRVGDHAVCGGVHSLESETPTQVDELPADFQDVRHEDSGDGDRHSVVQFLRRNQIGLIDDFLDRGVPSECGNQTESRREELRPSVVELRNEVVCVDRIA